MRRPRTAALAVAALAAAMVTAVIAPGTALAVPGAAGATPAAALASPAVPAAAGPGKAMVRVAHFSPDASYVDVYMVSLNRRQLFPNVFYKSVSAYWAVAAGPFTYEVRAAGAVPESEPVIQVKGDLAAGGSYTVAAVGRRDRLQGLLLRDDLAPAAAGKAKVRFLDAAYDLPAVDVAVAGGPVLASRLAFPEPTGYRQVDSGRYRIEVRRAGAGSTAGTGAGAVLAKGTVAVRPGTVTSVAVLGGAAGRVSCSPSAMPPGPGRRRPAASAPGPAGPRHRRGPGWPRPEPGGGRGRGVAVPPGPGPGSPGPCGGAGRGGDGHVAPRIGLSDAVGDARPTPAPPPSPC